MVWDFSSFSNTNNWSDILGSILGNTLLTRISTYKLIPKNLLWLDKNSTYFSLFYSGKNINPTEEFLKRYLVYTKFFLSKDFFDGELYLQNSFLGKNTSSPGKIIFIEYFSYIFCITSFIYKPLKPVFSKNNRKKKSFKKKKN